MARSKRSDVFDPDVVGVYHCFNRIVRRSFLCGYDHYTGNDYSHRRGWFYERLKYFAGYFAIDVLGYAVLSNHYHLVLRNRPDQVQLLSDRQVVEAWLMVCPGPRKGKDGTIRPPSEEEIQYELHRPDWVCELRKRLSNPSWLLRQLDQYMGIRCNAEDGARGHFWEARFVMRRLLDEAAVLACLAYVDLNPIRGRMAESLEEYPYVSIGERLRTLDGGAIEPSSWLAPIALAEETDRQPVKVVNRLKREELAAALQAQHERPLGCLPMQLDEYAELLQWLACNAPAVAREEQPKPRCSAGEACAGQAPASPAATSPTEQTRSAEQVSSAELPCSTEQVGGGRRAGPAVPLRGEVPQLLSRMGLDPAGFLDLVLHFEERFFTAAGCPASLDQEAQRRGRGRLNGPGRHALARRAPSQAVR